MISEAPDSKSLMAEWRDLVAAKEPMQSESEKAEALREYKRLLDMIDEVLKEQIQRSRNP